MIQAILRDNKNNQWLKFEQPSSIFQTQDMEAIPTLLEQVEKEVKTKQQFAVGFLSYEAAPAFDPALQTHTATDFPQLYFALFDRAKKIKLPSTNPPSPGRLHWEKSISEPEYREQFQKIKALIKAGHTYQVNYSFRQKAEFFHDPLSFFQYFASDAPYAAFIELPHYAICSASPELFFHYDQNKISCRPMKGTASRGRYLAEDEEIKEQLYLSEKDRAENVMIVDMIRNDLSRIAEPGTVKVNQLFETEQYPTLWQMTSSVEAQSSASLQKIMQALFPCASITGAPKVETMKIIRQLENTPRNIYTGSIGLIKPDGEMQFSVAIRTALIDKQQHRIEYGCGGGITWGSETEKEYAECLLKSKVIKKKTSPYKFDLLESLLWTKTEGFFLLREHLNRMQKSAQYFNFHFDCPKVQKTLQEYAEGNLRQRAKIRLLLHKNGDFHIEHTDLPVHKNTHPLKLCFAEKPVNKNNPLLFHKTTNRGLYNHFLQKNPDFDEVILWNKSGAITECCNANIVIRKKGKLLSPPIECGLLNGTFRQHLLDQGTISEAVLYREDVLNAEELWLINSVRKWRKAFIEVKAQV